MKPEYTRCRARVGRGQCTNEITFDAEGDYWSNFCDEHNAEDNAARESGEPRVSKFNEDQIKAKIDGTFEEEEEDDGEES